jgi:hypothetical protein
MLRDVDALSTQGRVRRVPISVKKDSTAPGSTSHGLFP